jgi:hypothetical protein
VAASGLVGIRDGGDGRAHGHRFTGARRHIAPDVTDNDSIEGEPASGVSGTEWQFCGGSLYDRQDAAGDNDHEGPPIRVTRRSAGFSSPARKNPLECSMDAAGTLLHQSRQYAGLSEAAYSAACRRPAWEYGCIA